MLHKLKLLFNKHKWHELNKHNRTSMGNLFDTGTVNVGNYSYGVLNVFSEDPKYKLNIGSYCSIGPDVKFILCWDHPANTISTYPFKVMMGGEKSEAISKGNINIGDNVWIGSNVLILSGVNIGTGAIVAAGSVVTKDIPPYSIVGGVPAKIIKMKFSKKIIEELLKYNFAKLSEDDIKENMDLLYTKITDSNYKKIINGVFGEQK